MAFSSLGIATPTCAAEITAQEVQIETEQEELDAVTESEENTSAQQEEETEAPTEEATVAVESISLNKRLLDLVVGDTYELTATISPEDATAVDLTWESDDEAVVTVEDGVVKAIAAGEAVVSVSVGGKRANCLVTVSEYQAPVEATGISLDAESLTMMIGDQKKVNATVEPADLTDYTIQWTSNNTEVAEVDSDGMIQAVGEGSAAITAVVDEQMATVEVTVSALHAAKVDLNKTAVTLDQGKTYALKATVTPAGAVESTVNWSTSNKAVATVSSAGKVTAVGPGKATIKATTENGKSASCTVTVRLSAPTSVKAATAGSTKIKITYAKVTNAAKYTIYRATTKDGKYSSVGTSTTTSFTDSTCTVGKTYYYKVRAVASNTAYNSVCSAVVSATALPVATTVSSNVTATASTIKITWKKVSEATGYLVYRKTSSGSWTKVATVKGAATVTYTDKNATTLYDYRVRVYKTVSGKNYYSAYSNTIRTRVLKKTRITIDDTDNWRTVILNWTKISGANKYEIYVRKGETGSWSLVTTVGNITSYTATIPTHGVYCYWKIRPVYTSGTTVTKGEYSGVSEGWISYYNPNYETWMSDKTDRSTTLMMIHVTNNGVGTMRFYSKNAYSSDHDYYSYDRDLTLVNETSFTAVSYIDIKKGESKWLCFRCSPATWYDEKTTIYCNMRYDGMNYRVSCSSYYGTSYWERD